MAYRENTLDAIASPAERRGAKSSLVPSWPDLTCRQRLPSSEYLCDLMQAS